MVELNQDMTIIKCNKEFMAAFEYKRMEIKNKTLMDLLTPNTIS